MNSSYKLIFITITSAVLLLAGCSKNDGQPDSIPVEEVTMEIQAGISDMQTKGTADYDGNAVKVNHWILEVLDDQGTLIYRDVKNPSEGTLQQTFKVSLVKNLSYTLLFWADCNNGYYNTGDLTNVSIANPSAFSANDDARDAFSASEEFTANGSRLLSVTLYRPLAQVNVITTDLEYLWQQAGKTSQQEAVYSKFTPTNLTVRVKVPTSFNVKTQECGQISTSQVTISAAECYYGYEDDKKTPQEKTTFARHANPATLFMGYIFTTKQERSLVNIDFGFTTNSVRETYSFNNVPVQANYRTNIIGDLFSYETEWTVSIEPAWSGEYYYR